MRQKILLIIILVLSAVLRLIMLDSYPSGFSGDETQQGYSAYSILKTGNDEWGQFLPLNPRGFGDFKPPLFTYLITPSVAIFGLNEFAIRFPSAVLGILTVLITYFLAKNLFNNNLVGLWSAFFLSISPWHIQLSRTAFEANAGIFFFTLGLLFFLKKENIYLILASIAWGLTLYTYHSFRVFIALFILGAIIFLKRQLFKKALIIPALILIVFVAPLILSLPYTSARASDVGIFSKNRIEAYFKNKGTSPIPRTLDRVFDNKILFVVNQFLDNYFSYYSLTFFFTSSRSDSSYLNFPGFPLAYRIELIFWITSLIIFSFKRGKSFNLLFLWFTLAPIPASLAEGPINAHRSVTYIPLVAILSGFGAKNIINLIKKNVKLKEITITGTVTILMLVSLATFLHFYLVQLPKNPPLSIRREYREVFTKIWELEKDYDNVVISKVFSAPQMFLAYYGKVDPIEYQQASQDWLRYEKSGKLYMDQMESWNLGKFLFEDLGYESKSRFKKNALLVSSAEDFPENIKSVYDVKNTKGKVLYRLVSTKEDEQ